VKRPLFFVLIGDSFLCEEKRKEILASFQKEFGPNFAVTLCHTDDLPVTQLLSEARTLPFLAPAQLLCVRSAERLTKNDLETLGGYFESPNLQTFFIFEAEKLDKAHPLLEWAKKWGQVISLQAQQGRIAEDFVQKKLKQARKKISPDALRLLESRVGDSFIFLDSLLDQLILDAGDKSEIDPSTVEALEEKLIRFEGFDLIESLQERNLPQALQILNDLLELNGEDFISLLGLLHWQLRRFWEAKKAMAEGAQERDLCAKLRLYPPRDAIFFRHLRRFSRQDLEKIIETLFDLDWKLKTGRAEGRYEVESWLVNAIG